MEKTKFVIQTIGEIVEAGRNEQTLMAIFLWNIILCSLYPEI